MLRIGVLGVQCKNICWNARYLIELISKFGVLCEIFDIYKNKSEHWAQPKQNVCCNWCCCWCRIALYPMYIDTTDVYCQTHSHTQSDSRNKKTQLARCPLPRSYAWALSVFAVSAMRMTFQNGIGMNVLGVLLPNVQLMAHFGRG